MRDSIRANVITGLVAGLVFYGLSNVDWKDVGGLRKREVRLASINPVKVESVRPEWNTVGPCYFDVWEVEGRDRIGRPVTFKVWATSIFRPAVGEWVFIRPTLMGYSFNPIPKGEEESFK